MWWIIKTTTTTTTKTVCGGRREFEFQVLPQLLHYLQVDRETTITTTITDTTTDTITTTPLPITTSNFSNKKDFDIDWGTLDIYSCINSCCAGNSNYCEEIIIVQPPPLFLW